MSATAIRTAISLEVACDFAVCSAFAFPLHKQLSEGNYGECSVMPIPESVADWRYSHRTARKRAIKAKELGYRFVIVRRHGRAEEIHEINTSSPQRQGRPMSPGYGVMPSQTEDPHYPCRRHGIHAYGVETRDGVLASYLWLYRAGQLGLVSQILGHADHLDAGIMYLLWDGMLAFESFDPDGFIVYNRHDSGTQGLRFYKERCGLTETAVEWLL